MSDLIIKGMEMLKHAIKSGTDDTLYRSCVIVRPDGTAELILDSTFANMFAFKHNLNRFPLVAIPTPHGRLIDADRLLAIIKSAAGNQLSVPLSAVIGSIEHAPTVIEAEE